MSDVQTYRALSASKRRSGMTGFSRLYRDATDQSGEAIKGLGRGLLWGIPIGVSFWVLLVAYLWKL